MKLIYLLILVLLTGSVFATSCTSSSDCPDDEYCGSYGQCVPYSSYSGGSSSGCCGSSILLALGLGAVFLKTRQS